MAVVQHLNLPASIAAGRHRLELNEGLQNLELPVSRMSASHSFAMFVERIVVESKRFADVYNNCLAEYRRVHRIRSRSHPVPELEADGPWQEIPFWIWTTASPNRRRLFSNRKAEVIELTDRAGWSVTLNQNGFADSLQELNQLDTDVFIRPRALATTMFSRLFASDLFLHGIGGAKYDQLNDEVMKAFFEIQPPAFMTMSATMKLPFEFDDVSKQNVTQLEAQLRQLRYHPEFHVADGEAANRKGNLIENPPMSGSRKAWRDEIAALNEKLFESLTVQRQKLETEITEATSSLPTSKILGSREFSFALFPKSLIAQLQAMSA